MPANHNVPHTAEAKAKMSAANPKEKTMYIKPAKRSLLSMPRWQAIGVALFLIIAFGIAGQADYEEERRQAEQYCEMVQLWKQSGGQAGWPAYDGEGTCP